MHTARIGKRTYIRHAKHVRQFIDHFHRDAAVAPRHQEDAPLAHLVHDVDAEEEHQEVHCIPQRVADGLGQERVRPKNSVALELIVAEDNEAVIKI